MNPPAESAPPLSSASDSADLNRLLTNYWREKQNPWRTLSNALILTRREVRDSLRDWRITAPIFLLTLVFPVLANLASALFANLIREAGDVDTNATVDALLPLMPMLVGFFPVSISLVIALETFVGERERLSLEPLLSTPLTNTELYIGKVLAAIFPPLMAGYLGVGLYVAGQILGAQQWRPPVMLLVQIMTLTTLQAFVMVTGAVVISSQTTSTRAANLLASFVIIPISMLVIIESIIMIQPGLRHSLWWIGAALFVVTLLLMRTGTRIFNREELLGRAIDQLNFRWFAQTFASQWSAGAPMRQPLRWYRVSVGGALRSLKRPLLFFGLCAVLGFGLGWQLRAEYPLPLDPANTQDEVVLNNLNMVMEASQERPELILYVLLQNTRVLIFATLAGMFTFGVVAILLTALPFVIIGYLMANLSYAGIDPLPYIALVVAHGWVEIPAIAIAAAAAIRLGMLATSPPPAMSIGEAWVRQLAETVKIGVFVVFPLLIIAAILEVQFTTRVAQWVFGV
jgi:uncharacterized membrane protein SpoIIM required for sporulation/ABC-type transport system involved in multi-copper enzyme maturation permease subunit